MSVLKKSGLLTKFFFLSIFFFLITILLLIVSGIGFITILISGLSILVFILLAVIFLKFEIEKPLRDFKILTAKLSRSELNKDQNQSDDLDIKINELNNIAELMKVVKDNKSPNKDIAEIHDHLQKMNDRLIIELNTAKTFKVNRNEFLGNVAHELRTPIFAIQLSLETLIDGAITDEKVNMDFLQRAMKQADRLRELVNDLISISKIETGMKLSKRYFTLSDYINGLIGELNAIAENKDISLTFENRLKDGTQVLGDSEQLKQVFVNLIENSIKYTPQHGTVNVRATENEKDVLIEIIDNGIGIPEKDIPRIFERFYRVDKNRSRDRGGSGLGLSIVKHILEAHGSNIEVVSKVDSGTNFRFTLQK